jgi:general secretion pathway protein K
MTTSRHERGIALVIVLWVGLLVVAIAGAFILDTRNSTQLTRNFLDNAEARALADGGVHLAIFEVLRADDETQWQRDGRVYQRAVPGGTLDISIEDEAGKIDINSASDELLEGLFLSAGVDGDTASTFAQAIEKFRREEKSRTQSSRASGESRARIRRTSSVSRRSARRKADRVFHSVDSLGQIPGMTVELHALLRPALTVFGDSKLHYMSSPREALMAIPGITSEAVDMFLLGRTGDEASGPLADFLVEGRARAYWRKKESKFLTVKVRAQSENGAVFTRVAIVEMAEQDDQPFIVKEWREGDSQSIPPNNPIPAQAETLSGGAI